MFGYEPFQPLQSQAGQDAFGLSIETCRPQESLSRLIHSFVQVSVDKPTAYPVIPDGLSALYVGRQSTVCAVSLTRTVDFQLPAAGEYFGVRFFPGALRRLFGLDLTDTSGQLLDAAYLPDKILSSLHKHLFRYDSFEWRVKVCEDAVTAIGGVIGGVDCRAAKVRESSRFESMIDKALAGIYATKGEIEIEKTLAAGLGVSARHLNRLFASHVGMSAKRFAQVIRMQNVCRFLQESPKSSLLAAIRFGYFDQAHLLKDFKKHIQASPEGFFSRFRSDFYNTSKV